MNKFIHHRFTITDFWAMTRKTRPIHQLRVWERYVERELKRVGFDFNRPMTETKSYMDCIFSQEKA